MAYKGNDISADGSLTRTGRLDDNERAYLESLIRSDYERCHPDETLEHLKQRAQFSKEDKGLLRDWLALAARRASASRADEWPIDVDIAA